MPFFSTLAENAKWGECISQLPAVDGKQQKVADQLCTVPFPGRHQLVPGRAAVQLCLLKKIEREKGIRFETLSLLETRNQCLTNTEK